MITYRNGKEGHNGGLGMTWEGWLIWVEWAYFGAAAFAAFFTVITVVTGYAQNRLNARISENKDRTFAEFRFASEIRAKELEGEIATAKSEGEKAKERAASLEEKTEILRIASTQLAIQLEQERISRLKLQSMLSSRHISPEQAERIANTIRGKVSKVRLQVTSEAESLSFAQDIADTLTKAGVEIDGEMTGVMIPTPYGLQMSIPENAKALGEAFANDGFSPLIRTSSGSIPVILVGQKPPSF